MGIICSPEGDLLKKIAAMLLLFSFVLNYNCADKKGAKLEADPPNVEETEPNNKRDEALSVKNGTIAKGFINEKLDQDWYKISIPDDSSAILRAELSGIVDLNIKMELFDENQELLQEVDHNKEGKGEIITNYQLGTGDTYIRVRELWLKEKEKKFNDTTAYKLKITFDEVSDSVELEPNNKAILATPIKVNSVTKGYISPYQDIDWYRLPLGDGVNKYLELSLSGLENVDTKLKVYDPIEAVIYTADKGSKGESEKITNLGIDLEKDFYYITVEGGNWQTNQSATYELTVNFIETLYSTEFEPNDRLVKASELAVKDTVYGFIDDKKDVDWYRIVNNVKGDQIVRVELNGIPKVDLKLSLYNELEELLISADDTGEQENEIITNFGLIEDQNYYLKVEAGKGLNLNDKYSISLNMSPHYETEEFELNDTPDQANSIEVERAVAGFIHPKKDVDFYRLELPGRYTGNLEIILEGIMKVNTNMILYDDQMNEVAKAVDKPTEGIERIKIEAVPGTYYIKVYDNDNQESNYRDKYKLFIFVN